MKQWFIWWASRLQWVYPKWIDNGSWFGPQYLTEGEALQLEISINSNSGAKAYRMVWTGSEWKYDQRLLGV